MVSSNSSNEYVGLSSGLLTYIRESRGQLDDWVEEEKSHVNKAWDDYRQQRVVKEQAEIDDQVANLLALRLERGCVIVESNDEKDKDEIDIERQTSNMAKKALELQEQAQGLKAAITKLHERQQQRLEQLQDVTKDKEQKRAKAEAIQVEKEAKQAAKEARLNKFTKVILQYQQHLGFHFETAENLSVRLWFTQLDPNDPERAFSFRLSADDQDLYVVEDCQPNIQPDIVEQILHEVNETDRGPYDFSQLILSMRKAFAATII